MTSFIIQICLLYAFVYTGPLSTRQARYYMKILALILFLWISMTMTIRLLGAPLPAMLIICLIQIPMILVTMIMTVVFAETSYPFGLKSDCGGQGSVLLVNATEKRFIYQSLQKHAIIYFFFLISQNSGPLNLQ